MRSFFKIFFASLLSLVVFSLICIFFLVAIVSSKFSKDKPDVPSKSVLVIDLGQHFPEQMQSDPIASLSGMGNIPGLYDVIRLLNHAKTDNNISGVFIQADQNTNGFASSNELRSALIDFKSSKKFVIAHGDVMSQGAYFVATAADKIYVNPTGNFDWKGYAVSLFFVKDLLDKLQIQPQIFYAGKYKSATEIFRVNQMTPENKLQTTVWLNDLYNYFLQQVSKSRDVDTASLHQLANTAAIQTPEQAVANKLIDGVKYDDEIKSELKSRLSLGKTDKLSLVSINNYNEAVTIRKTGSDRIAVIYAEGNIVDGNGTKTDIGGDNYVKVIRRVRLDNSIKAIVLRVNSGGGSALASEKIWRELSMARQDGKPVVVSFGDVAASGGYYISCGADSIFASPNTITGSIGVFGVIPNMEGFFKNKLGISFDGVKTAPFADGPTIIRPMNEAEKQHVQSGVDRIYLHFKQRVAQGRKKDINYIDSIAQGRVWSGASALQLGLVDRIGTLQDAVNSAAKMAKISSYGMREYPEYGNWLDDLLGRNKTGPEAIIKEKLGEENYKVFQQIARIKEMSSGVQARLPFEFMVR